MKQLNQVALEPHQKQALIELQTRLTQAFEIDRLILFGSIARGEADKESDIDLLILTKNPPSHALRHQMTDVTFEVNLEYNTTISNLVVDKTAWDTGVYTVLPIHHEINQDGVLL